MAAAQPKLTLYVSSISSSLKLRQAHETARRCLRGSGLAYEELDIARRVYSLPSSSPS
jgi:hypothetical protein